jgi:hypothetical protein
MVFEVLFSTSGTNRRVNHLTFGDMPIGNQALSTVSNVLKFDALYPFGLIGRVATALSKA